MEITNADFLKFNTNNKYDFIVMNPPYANKRLESHLTHALTMLGENGELLIVAPTGKEKTIREIAVNKSVNIISNHENVFDDTAIHTSVYSISLRGFYEFSKNHIRNKISENPKILADVLNKLVNCTFLNTSSIPFWNGEQAKEIVDFTTEKYARFLGNSSQ